MSDMRGTCSRSSGFPPPDVPGAKIKIRRMTLRLDPYDAMMAAIMQTEQRHLLARAVSIRLVSRLLKLEAQRVRERCFASRLASSRRRDLHDRLGELSCRS